MKTYEKTNGKKYQRIIFRLRKHAKTRFLERFHYCLTDEDLESIESIIVKGNATLIDWRKGKPGIYIVTWNDLSFLAVFDYSTNKIITFLTLDMRKSLF